MNLVNVHNVTNENSTAVQLLQAVQLCNLVKVEELLQFLDNVDSAEVVNMTFGPMQITPLELASTFKTKETIPLIQLLIKFGADASYSDKLGRTPLHLAASNGFLELVELFIKHGAVIDSKYELNSLPYKSRICDDLGIYKLLNVPECWGRTPLHQAVKGNHKEVVKLLLQNGANANAEDEYNVTPILLAGAGLRDESLSIYEEIISLLILYEADVDVYTSYTGTTPLHHAVCLNSLPAVKKLLQVKAVMKPGTCGQLPIHEAAGRGYCDILSLLLEYEDVSVNRADNDGRTPLHKAAFTGSRECIRVLVDHGGDLSTQTKSKVSVMDVIFSHVPRPLHLIDEILNSKITCNDVSYNDVDFKVTLDFKILSPRSAVNQMSVIQAILTAGNNQQSVEILRHPLIETFLHLKWARLRIFFMLLVIIHFVFVVSLSFYVMLIVHRPAWSDFMISFSRSVLLLSAFVLFFHALIQCFLVPRHYFRQYEMWLNLLCAFFSFIVAIAHSGMELITSSGEKRLVPDEWILHVTSIVILLAWMELMLLIGRFPTYGYYALMFSAVLQNVVKVLLTFVCLVIGFALSFSIQFHSDEQFTDPWRSIVKTTVMMMGEFDYADLFSDMNSTSTISDPIRLPATSRLIFIMFIILASIVLMNLMVGLAVSDIQGLQREGHAKRLAKQGTFLSHLEKVLSHKWLKSDWFPSDLLREVYSKRNINVVLVLKPGRKGATMDLDNNVLKHIPYTVLESIITVAIETSQKPEETNDAKNTISEIVTTLKDLQNEINHLKNNLFEIRRPVL